MSKHLSLCSVSLLSALALAAGCEQFSLSPKITVNLKVVEACDADPKALDGVETMQLIAQTPDEEPKSISAKKGDKSATVGGLEISDGTEVFVNGFAGNDTSATPVSSGASTPLNLKSYQDSKAFPASPLPARQYPDGQNTTVNLTMGRLHSFGGTTDAASAQCSTLMTGRHGHTATFLGQAGKVVIVGGLTYAADGSETFVPRDRAIELYDPNTGTFAQVTELRLPGGGANASLFNLMQRAFHTATALPDGSVLVVGGIGSSGNGDAVQPLAVSFRLTANDNGDIEVTQLGVTEGFQNRRFHHQATLTKRGDRVLITGGCGCVGDLSKAQVLQGMCPAAGDNCSGGQPRVSAIDEVTVGADGAVRFTTVQGGVLAKARAFHTATAIDFSGGDIIIVAGGDDGTSPAAEVEMIRRLGGQAWLVQTVLDLGLDRVTRAAAVALPESDCSLLVSDSPESECVLLTGGCTSVESDGTCPATNIHTGSTVIYKLGVGSVAAMAPGPTLTLPRYDHQAFLLPNGKMMALLAGGKCSNDNCEKPTTPATEPVPIIAGDLLERRDAAGFQPVQYKHVRTRYASTVFPSGQIMLSGGVLGEQATNTKVSESSADLFFFAFRTVSR
ncbi:MAG: kelch repeat-containing protein [Myxococcota bacterium]